MYEVNGHEDQILVLYMIHTHEFIYICKHFDMQLFIHQVSKWRSTTLR